MVKKINVEFKDSERNNLGDSFGGPKKDQTSSFMKGRFQIHEKMVGDKKLYLVEDTENLIVYRGRNWLMQRAFNKDITSRANWRTKFVSFLGIGEGGTPIGQPLTPTAPDLTDYGMGGDGSTQLEFGGPSGNVVVGLDANEYHRFDTGYPWLSHDQAVTDLGGLDGTCTQLDPEDSLTYPCDSFLIAKCKITIGATEANGAGSQNINECGLYMASATENDQSLFARVTFSTIQKDANRELIFSWYIYF